MTIESDIIETLERSDCPRTARQVRDLLEQRSPAIYGHTTQERVQRALRRLVEADYARCVEGKELGNAKLYRARG